jgi:hypothetical protein
MVSACVPPVCSLLLEGRRRQQDEEDKRRDRSAPHPRHRSVHVCYQVRLANVLHLSELHASELVVFREKKNYTPTIAQKRMLVFLDMGVSTHQKHI